MKIFSFIFLSLFAANLVQSQCTAPAFTVDLSAVTDSLWILHDEKRGGVCCGSSNCVTFNVTTNPGTELISFDVTNPSPSGSAFYRVNCGTAVSIGTPLCIVGLPSPLTITYCKPGGDSPDYLIEAGTVVHANEDISIQITGCTDTLTVNNVDVASVVWTSIYPGAVGAYNSYLSCTSGCNTTLVTPTGTPPPYVDYMVSGAPSTTCGSAFKRDTVRVFFVPHIQGTIDPQSPVICASSGTSVTLTASAWDGAAPYHFKWSTGPSSNSITVSTASTYTVTISDKTNCPPITRTRTIGTIPEATFTYSELSICQNEANPLPVYSGNGQPGQFTVSPAGLAFVSSSTGQINLATSTPGTYNVTNTIAPSGTCPGATDTKTITIYPYPVMTSASSASACSKIPVNIPLTSTISSTYTWIANDNPNVTGESLTTQTTSTLSNILLSNSGVSEVVTYTVIPTSTLAGGCVGSPQTVTVTLNPTENADFIYNSSTNCQTGFNPTTTITGEPGGTFSSTAGLVFVSTSTGEVNLAASTLGSYVVTYTTNGTCPNSETFPITITMAPIATFSYSDDPYCQSEGNPIPTFIPLAGAGIFTSIQGGLVFEDGLTGEVNISLSAPGTYDVINTIAASGGCSVASDTSSITITQQLAALFSYTGTPYCQNESNPSPVYSGGGVAGTFSAPAGLSINSGDGLIDLAASTPGIYNVSNTIAAIGGCPLVIEYSEITVTALPVATFSYDGTPYCQNETDPLPTIGGGSTSEVFSTSSVFLNINSSTGLLDLTTSEAGNYFVTNTIAASGGCPLVFYSTPVTLTALPIATLSFTGTPYCQTDTDPTPEIAAGGSNGIFTSLPVGLVIEPSSGTVDLAISTPGSYTVTNTIAAADGCEEVAAQTPITVTALPTASISYSGSPFCDSHSSPESVTFSGTVGGTYSADPAGLTINPSTGEITPNTSTPGAYTVTYTIDAANGCGVVTTTTPVSVSSLPAATISYAGSPFCNTALPANVTFSGNTGGLFSSAANLTIDPATGDITPATSLPGTYTVTYTISAASGCEQVTATTPVSIYELPVASATSTGILCYGGFADIIVSATNGYSPYSGTGTFNEPDGTYNYTVTDINGCSSSTSITLTEPPLLVASSSSTAILCHGNTSVVSVTETGGTSPYTGDGPYTLASGNYSFTVTDANSCTSTTSITVSEPDTISASVTTTLAGCGLSDGSATVTASGGTGSLTYSWSTAPAQTTAIATGLSAGTYTVTTQDANNCTVTNNVAISNSGAPVVDDTIVNVLCHGLSTGTIDLTVTGGTGGYTYLWNGGLYTSEDLNNVSSGTYSYSVTDGANCIATGVLTISEPDSLSAASSATDVLCYGGISDITVTSTGGYGLVTGTGTYNVTAGSYNYIVTDSHSCTASTNITITQPDTLIAGSSATGILCYKDSSTVTVTETGGTAPFTGDGNYTEIAGTYNYIVTDANGCTSATGNTITQPDTLIASAIATDILCHNDSSEITVSATGGTGIYTGTGNFTVVAGTYSYTITDANLCSTSVAITITEPDSITASVSTTFAGCGLSDGTATVNVTGGTGTYSYLWQPSGGTDSTTTGLPAGNYSVDIQDINGCNATANAVILNNTAPIASTVQTDILCFGLSTGNVDLTVNGGTGTYTFLWNGGLYTTEDLTNVPAGTYIYVVTDSANCQVTGEVIITQPLLLEATINEISAPSCHNSINGQASVSVTGGVMPYIILWSDTAGTITDTISTLAGDTEYSTLITDNNGCTTTDTIQIAAPSEITTVMSTTDANCTAGNGSVNVVVFGGTAPFTFVWSDSLALGNDTLLNIPAGSYQITVTDINGCEAMDSVIVNSVNNSDVQINQAINVLCYGDSTGSISVEMVGGASPYNFLWQNDTTNNTGAASNLPAGIYQITITDANSCSADTAILITQSDAIVIEDTVLVSESNVGEIDITVSGGLMPYEYLWSNGKASEDISVLDNGTYIVTVTDINSCISIHTVIIDNLATDLVIPTAITPNDDGMNDNFEIKNIEHYSDIKIQIYNRWGDMLFVFEGSGAEYADPSIRWDGMYNGRPLPTGGYVFIIKPGQDEEPVTGVVTIIL